MKTLTTLTAITAFIAGISVASAAGTSSMGMHKGVTTMSKSARVIGTSNYCAKDKSGALNCKFASLSACRSVTEGASCVANPHTSMTGSK